MIISDAEFRKCVYNGFTLNLSSSLAQRSDYKWWIFGTIAIGTFVTVMDQTGVGLALPRIADHFDATIPAVQWITLGYILTTGSLMLPMGRLSDIIGRKRVYATGFVIFTIAAILAGSSTSLLAVILFKVLQGVGASMIQATGMAMVTSVFPSHERGKAIGLFMTVVGLGAIVGPVVGGAVVGQFGWRFVFFIGAPFGVISALAATLILQSGNDEEAANPGRRVGFDWGGAILFATALATFLLVMTNGQRIGWDSPIVWVAFVGVAALGATFIWWEKRTAEPMLALELFQRKMFTLGVSANFLAFLSGTSVFFLMPFYLQEVLGFSAGGAGLILAPTAMSFVVMGPIAGRLSDRFGYRWFVVSGLFFMVTSLVLLSRLDENSSVAMVIPSMLLQGIGMGTFFSPNASSVLSTVERARYGVATAFLNMLRNAANVTGVSLATTIVTAVMASHGYEASLDAVSGDGGQGVKIAFTQGLRTAYLVLSISAFIALVISIINVDTVSEPETVTESDPGIPSKV